MNGSVYQSIEEENVICNEETIAAQKCGESPLGEKSRPDHGGIPYITNKSTSKEILNKDNEHVQIWLKCFDDKY